MNKKTFLFLLFTLLFISYSFAAEHFRFALFTDLHISTQNEEPSEDLTNAVEVVNKYNDIDFVIVTGDITEYGDKASLLKAKELLSGLNIPYYITLGNHETTQNKSGLLDFIEVFGNDKFTFTHKGYLFVGFATYPATKQGIGHITTENSNFVLSCLKTTPQNTPVFICTHYPLQEGDVDNWQDFINQIQTYNIQAILSGHYHRNMFLNYNGICGVVHRSTLRNSKNEFGFTIISITQETINFTEKTSTSEELWLTLPFNQAN